MDYKFKNDGFIPEYKNDPFFDSLRNDYSEFDAWYEKSVSDKLKTSHYWLEDENVKAFIGIKQEDEEIALGDMVLPKAKRLKITTIKSEGIQGFSEFFIYQAIKRAVQLKISQVYFTVIPNSDEKQKLLQIAISYGFKIVGESRESQGGISRKDNEIYLVKNLKESEDTWKETYPSLDLESNPNFGIVVLEQDFHDNYIQDADLFGVKQRHDFTKMGIQKAYVHKQLVTYNLPVGSVICVYRKGNQGNARHTGVITGVGKVTKQFKKGTHYDTFDEFKALVKRMHAFDDEVQLKVWYEYGDYLTLFGLYYAFGAGNNVNLEFLEEIGLNQNTAVYNRKPTKEQFFKIFKKGRASDV